MPHQIEITRPGGAKNLLPMAGETLVVGSSAGADVMLHAPGLEPQHLRFVRTDVGVRVEPCRPGASVVVNGEELFCKDLAPNDVVDLVGLRLRWLPEPKAPAKAAPARPAPAASTAPVAEPLRPEPARAAAPPPRPVRSAVRDRNAADGADRDERPRRRAKSVGWGPFLVVFGLVLGGAVVAVKLLSNSTWPSSPADYVDLAREQLRNNQRERALETLAFAMKDATGAVREDALALYASVQKLHGEFAIAPKVDIARQELGLVTKFAERNLRDKATRPAAREFVRSCDRWLQRHREVCTASEDGKVLLRSLEEQRGRYVAIAAMEEPDTMEDVLFGARAKMSLQWREYKVAIRALDDYLAAHPGDAVVTAERETMLREGEEWLRGRLRLVDQLVNRGDTGGAQRDLRNLEEWSVLPQWEPLVKAYRAKLPADR